MTRWAEADFVPGVTLTEDELLDAELDAAFSTMAFPVRHDPATGRFLPSGSSGGSPVITAAEARGNSRAVSAEEFGRLSAAGRAMLEGLAESPPAGLDANWDKIVALAFTETQKSWGGVTVDSHTGKVLHAKTGFALTVKAHGQDSVTISEHATPAEFSAAMTEARRRFAPQLARAQHHLGVFHDDSTGLIDIDPVLVVATTGEVDALGAYTHAIGGAYDFSTGNGHFPPHVADTEAAATMATETPDKTQLAKFLAAGRDPNRPLYMGVTDNASAPTMAFPVRHSKADGKFLKADAVDEAVTITPDEAKAHFSSWAGALSEPEAAIVNGYTDPPKAAKINGQLRNRGTDRATLALAAQLCQTLAKAPPLPHTVKVNRGVVGAFAQQMLAMKPGETFTERGFTSTDVAAPYDGVNLEIHIPKGTRAAYLGGVSKHSAEVERELLIGRGATYAMRSQRSKPPPPTVVLDLVHQSPPMPLLGPVGVAGTIELAQEDALTIPDRFRWSEGDVVVNRHGTLDVDGEPFAEMSWAPDVDPDAVLAGTRDRQALGDAGVYVDSADPIPEGTLTVTEG